MRPYTLKLVSGEAMPMAAVGDYVRIKSALVAITVKSPDENEQADLEQGDSCVLTPFRRLELLQTSGVEQTVIIYVGKSTRVDSSKVGGSVSVSNVNGAFTQSGKSVTNASTLLVAANASRRYLLIQNNSTTGVLRVKTDGNAASATAGVRVQPGQAYEPVFAPTGAIYGFMETADATASNVEAVEG